MILRDLGQQGKEEDYNMDGTELTFSQFVPEIILYWLINSHRIGLEGSLPCCPGYSIWPLRPTDDPETKGLPITWQEASRLVIQQYNCTRLVQASAKVVAKYFKRHP